MMLFYTQQFVLLACLSFSWLNATDNQNNIPIALTPAPLFPELTPHYPLQFTEANYRLISDKEQRLKEWNQIIFPKPSWLALLALLASTSLLFFRTAKPKELSQVFSIKKIDGQTPSEAYIQVINSSREYLGLTYSLPAATLTLEETLLAIQRSPSLTLHQKNFLKLAYNIAEAIKFNQKTASKEDFDELTEKFQVFFPHFFTFLKL